MPHPHGGPSPPPNAAAYIETNVTVLQWDGATGTCAEQVYDPLDPNVTIPSQNCCKGGMFQAMDLPRRGGQDVWIPIIWCLILCWIFIPGVAMGADVFMTSIEVITSKEYKVVRKFGNQFKEYHVRVWNATVANLTLMALGSSAPEILLSIIEILGNNFYAGELGPSTIVGSAAFNLMVITAVCIVAIPKDQKRTIKQLGVFLCTATFSLWAYVWLFIIIIVSSPNVVSIEEGVITVLFLFVLIAMAFWFDRHGARVGRVMEAWTSVARRGARSTASSVNHQVSKGINGTTTTVSAVSRKMSIVEAPKMSVSIRDAASIAAEVLKERGTNGTAEELAQILEGSVHVPQKTRAHFRREQMKSLVGTAPRLRSSSLPTEAVDAKQRSKSTPERAAKAESTTAKNRATDTDGVSAESVGVTLQQFGSTRQLVSADLGGEGNDTGNDAGLLRWEVEAASCHESDLKMVCKVERVGGSSGEVTVQYKSKDQSALAGKDYERVQGELVFKDGDCAPKEVTVTIIDDDEFEKDEEFTLVLYEPTGGARFDDATDGGAEEAIMTVTIISDEKRAATLKQALMLLNVDNQALDLASSSWGEQCKEVFALEDRSLRGRIAATLAFPWKLMFAVVPPAGLCGGWLCFVGALCAIAIQVVLISDFASQMGCEMYLKDSVTAITFVALGTSLPDTFASMQAAVHDKTADNSIGNVTGSNSVNVFFGLGLPWLMAAIYWRMYGATDEWRRRYAHIPGLLDEYPNGAFVVEGGSLGFSVVVFTICASLTIVVILARRVCLNGAELGGSKPMAYASAALLVGLWLLYIVLSAIKSYESELGLGVFGF